MNGPQWPEVRPGQEITTALWDKAKAANRANRWRPGDGIRFTQTSDGIVVSAEIPKARFDHPFRVTLSGASSATILPGSVNGRIPLIDGIALDADPAPVLVRDELWLDADGRGYIALDFQCDADWKLDPATLEIVQVADWLTEDGSPADDPNALAFSGAVPGLSERRVRWPLAMLRDRTSWVDIYQLTMAGIQHKAVPSADGTTARHFFW